MDDVMRKIEELSNQADAELAQVSAAAELEQYRIKFLGASGLLKAAMKWLGQVQREQKPAIGQKLNALKERVTAAFEARKAGLSASSREEVIDVTEPGRRPQRGGRHLLMQVTDELTELFGRMGFSVAEGPEVEDEFHNFGALNIGPKHPARDPADNFYLSSSGGGLWLLRAQTSTVQIRVMERQKPPIRIVSPGRVYRPDTVDATHLFMFQQLEALVVDKNVSMIDLKSTIQQFVGAYFGSQARLRFRPSFFPFTEPSAEVDIWFEDKKRWIELGGCGMVHPNVFKAVGIDPEEYSGWAFGFGIERIAMRKYAIPDIRLFVENDVRFLRQF